ncbi:hypothetical protein AVEN_243443-1, partial [Araneus ventricosus]
MTRTTLELAPPLKSSAPHQREDVRPPTYDHGSSVESGFRPGIVRFRSRDLTTWPPRLHNAKLLQGRSMKFGVEFYHSRQL